MKNRELINAIESINALAAMKLPVRTSFAVALNLKAVRDHMEIFEEQRKKLVEKHTLKDKKGVPVPVYLPEKDAEGKPKVDAKGEATIVKDDKGEIVNKVHEGQIKLIDPKLFNKDIEELLAIDVTKEVNIRPIKLSDLEGSLEPQHFANIVWMIKED
jgi:hypothetical protein